MPAPELRIQNRTAYLRKAIRTPNFGSESVLTRDAFTFVELWLRRNCEAALPYWAQAKNYFEGSLALPPEASPLTLYYAFLNAAKALLKVKGVAFSERHGVSGEFDPTARRALSNEVVKIQDSGIVAALAAYLEEPEPMAEHTMKDLLGNLPYIHRAFRHTYASQTELFIPLVKPVYRQHPTDPYVWFSAEIHGRFADKRTLRTLPERFEVDAGWKASCVIRTKKRVKWSKRGDSAVDREAAWKRLCTLHRTTRLEVKHISGQLDYWYLKRPGSPTRPLRRYDMTIAMAAMHRLSELSRYDPRGLVSYLGGKENWLISEFIQLAPKQFMDELVCEMTSLELRLPGVRP